MDKCQLCFNLSPEALSHLIEGQLAIVFIFLSGLKDASLKLSQICLDCQIIWKALSMFKGDWDVDDMRNSIELRIAIGRPLQLICRTAGLHLELYLPRRIGMHSPHQSLLLPR